MVKEIVAVNVVHIAVAVVIDAVPGDLVLVGPKSVHKLRMLRIHAGVDDGHHHVPALLCSGLRLPHLIQGKGLGHVHVHALHRLYLPVFKIPGLHGAGRHADAAGTVPFHIALIKLLIAVLPQIGNVQAQASVVFEAPLVDGIGIRWSQIHITRPDGLGPQCSGHLCGCQYQAQSCCQ